MVINFWPKIDKDSFMTDWTSMLHLTSRRIINVHLVLGRLCNVIEFSDWTRSKILCYKFPLLIFASIITFNLVFESNSFEKCFPETILKMYFTNFQKIVLDNCKNDKIILFYSVLEIINYFCK